MKINDDWYEVLNCELEKPYMDNLFDFLKKERKNKNIYPAHDDTFYFLNKTPIIKTKVIIVGQDPYCIKGQAHGLSFSVPSNVKIPGSLKNIYKELYDDLGIEISKSGCLLKWANEGVLLLNSILTVEENKPGSHFGKGWEMFTDKIISFLSDERYGLVFVLWGKYAMKKQKLINMKRHLVITSSHPSEKSANVSFFGSRPFSKINIYLKSIFKKPINWEIK